MAELGTPTLAFAEYVRWLVGQAREDSPRPVLQDQYEGRYRFWVPTR